jgi:exosome complex RNA-binding protein Rrp42 (RNase PH superfamily)
MHYVDIILQMTTNWNKVFVIYSEVDAGNFTTLVYSALLNVDKSVLEMEALWKSSLMIAEDVWIILVNLIIIGVTFSEEKMGPLLSYHP